MIKHTTARLAQVSRRLVLVLAACMIALVAAVTAPQAAYATNTTAYVNCVKLSLYSTKSTSSAAAYLRYNDELTLVDCDVTDTGYLKVKYEGTTYYVYQNASAAAAGSKLRTEAPKTSATEYSTYSSATSYQKQVLEEAISWLTQPTVYKTSSSYNSLRTTPTGDETAFTCSPFAAYVLNTVMVENDVLLFDVSTTLSALYAAETTVNEGFDNECTVTTVIDEGEELDESLLQPGDIIFFDLLYDDGVIDHCGIYLGDGEFIHSSASSYSTYGWSGVCVMPLSGIYSEGFVAARRYLPESVSPINQTMYTTSLKTNVFADDSSSATKIDTLTAEVPVTLIWADGSGNPTYGAEWGYISYTDDDGDTAYGYVYLKYLSSTDPDATSSTRYALSSLKLYKTTSTSGSYITIAKYTQVTYYGQFSTTNYYKVDYNGTRYYVYCSGAISNKLGVTYSLSSAKATLSYSSTTYSGSYKKPTVTLKTSAGVKINTSYYTVSYSSNKAIGTATVTIKGKGKWRGTITKTFTIKPKQVTVSSLKSSSSKKLTVKWSKLSGSVTSYQIRYRIKGASSWKTATITSSSSTISKTISGLTSGKTYQVQVRGYKKVSGTTYYGAWSSVKTVKVK